LCAILTDHGFEDFDVSSVSGDLGGYVQADITSARALLEPLMDVFQVDVAEDGGTLNFRSRLRTSLAPREIAVLADIDDEPLWSENRGHDSDFAAEAALTFYNPVLDYEQASVRSRRAQTASERTVAYDLPATLGEEAALSAVETLLRAQRVARRSLSLAISPAEVSIVPGDAIQLPGMIDGTFVVERVEDGAFRRIEARHHAALPPTSVPRTTSRRSTGSTASSGFAPILHFLDLPRLSMAAPESFACVAAYAKPWRRIALSSSATTEGYRQRVTLDRPARIGTLAADLPAGMSGRFQHGDALEIGLFFDGLSSVAPLAVLGGENRIAVMAQNGVWEIVGFLSAEEISTGRWQLTGLLRGLSGTEDAMLAGALTGAACIVLDEAVVSLGLAAEERGRSLNWLAENLGGVTERFGPTAFVGGERAETPLSPVHLRGRRQADGSIGFSWTRRGRVDADSWEGAEIPMDEPFERYCVELLDGPAVRRVVDIDGSLFDYSATDEIADFGSRRNSIELRIRQMGRAVPLGIPAQAMIQV
jgi:hypothetical protein